MKLLHHARIYTLDPSLPVASVIAIDHGVVIAVGGDELLSGFDRAEKQNMEGRVILPGLTDAHLHFQYYALGLEKMDCETDTLEACLQRVAERVRRVKPGEWLLGHGWNQNVWGQGGWPSASDLDPVTPDHHAYLTAKSLHAAWANSAALRLANITASTPDPKDGQIQRTVNGEPTGILFENAMQLVGDIVPAPDTDGLARLMEQAQTILWKMGLTGIHDFDRRDWFMALQKLHADGKLKLRVTKEYPC